LMTLKIAVFAPIPSASVRIETMVNVGCRDYEGIWILPLLGYMIYVFPIWIAAVMIVVLLELIFVPNRRPSVVSFGLR